MQRVKDILFFIVAFFARVHDTIMLYNDSTAEPFSDKQLHFLVIGFFSLLMLILLYPFFLFLVRHSCVGIITWLFGFLFIVFTCFSIEFGQQLTNTGKMELGDIAYGVMGFFSASGVAALLLLLLKGIILLFRLIGKRRKPVKEKAAAPEQHDDGAQLVGKHIKSDHTMGEEP